MAGRSAAAANTRSAGTFRSASSMTIPISIGPLEDQLSDVPPQAWAAACRSLTGDIKVQSLTARLNYRFGG
jgi:hypothetical protein